jgi:hypothetical protein
VTQNNSASKGLALEVTHHPACDLAAGGPESFLGELVERIIDAVGPGQTGRCVVWWHAVDASAVVVVVVGFMCASRRTFPVLFSWYAGYLFLLVCIYQGVLQSLLGELVERIIDVVGPGQTGRCVDFVWWHPVKQVLMRLVVWCAVGWWSLRRGCWYEGGTQLMCDLGAQRSGC